MRKFPFLTTRLSEVITNDFPNYKLAIGTILRLQRDGIWYDVELQSVFYSGTEMTNEDILKYTQNFIDIVYFHQQSYIITDKDEKSRLQISESDRIHMYYKMNMNLLNQELS